MYTARRAGHDSGNQVLRNRGFGARIRSSAETVKRLRSLPRSRGWARALQRRRSYRRRSSSRKFYRVGGGGGAPGGAAPVSSESSEIAAETAESTAEAASSLPGYRGGGVQAQFGLQDPIRARKPRQRKPR